MIKNRRMRVVVDKLDELPVQYEINSEDSTVTTAINGYLIIFSFFDNGIQAVTCMGEECRAVQDNKADCLEFVNLYNAARRFPCCVINDEGSFFTQYWLGIGPNDEFTEDAFHSMLFAAVYGFMKSDETEYTLFEAIRDVCRGSRTPQQAIDRMS